MNVQAHFSQCCLGQVPNVNLTAKSFVAKLSPRANLVLLWESSSKAEREGGESLKESRSGCIKKEGGAEHFEHKFGGGGRSTLFFVEESAN